MLEDFVGDAPNGAINALRIKDLCGGLGGRVWLSHFSLGTSLDRS
jgi:hypothetical protein